MPDQGTTTQHARFGELVPLSVPGVHLRFESPESMSRERWAETTSMLQRAFNCAPAWSQIGVDPVDHFVWKTSAARGECVVELMLHKERVIGLKLQFRERFLVRGEPQQVDVGNDQALDPEFQGRRLSSERGALEVMPISASDFSLDRDTHPYYQENYEADGSIVVANRVQVLTRPLGLRGLWRMRRDAAAGPSQTAESAVRSGPRPRVLAAARRAGMAMRALWAGVHRVPRPATYGATVETISRFDGRADEFWAAVAPAFDLIQVRDASFLNWRYCDPRSGVGLVRAAIAADGSMLGFIAARETPAAVTIVDLVVRPGHEPVAGVLVADAVRWARRRGAPKVHAWLPAHHPLRSTFGAGWLVRDLAFPFVIKERDRPISEFAFLREPDARVHLVAGDTDHI